MTMMTDDQQAVAAPGAAFDVPGVPGGSTQWTEQDETTTNLATVLATGNSQPVNGIQQYRQTDVVADWFLCLSIAQTYTAGTSALTASSYAPYNYIGPTKQLIQNQYASVDVDSGIDLYIFDLIRPFNSNEVTSGVNLGANPAGSAIGSTALGYETAAIAQANNINAAQWAVGATGVNLLLRLPAAQWFDSYWDLMVTGEPTTAPHPALVSPQYMAGTTRVITPAITLAQGSGNLDVAPVNIGAGTGTFAGTATLRLRRKAIYAGNPATQPSVYAWQYRRKTTRLNVGGVQSVDLLIPLDTGQLLAVYTRMWDPAAAAGLGAPININTITNWNLQYGSGLFRFHARTVGGTTAAELCQRKWFEQHNSFLPPGVIAYDLATDDRGRVTNSRALNTLTTAGVLVHIDFTAPLSSTAYITLGCESLVYVT